MQDMKEVHTEQLQMNMRDRQSRATGSYRALKRGDVLVFFSLYRDEKASLKLKFSYVVLYEFKPFGGADNMK